ncbi:hypothetical protein AVEN_193925-1 [Araneus ventricosus]|uniref:Transposase Tc1-like domain-containing protein n=1 Tax=Araneus ventricosus TaxID=182803 RepID=A0A4Y2JVI2_ARAVE|nr:hypothetical protein AVEN_193925-1 [Araneus ventricosus]
MTNKCDDRQIQRLASTQQMTIPENQRSSGLSVSKDAIRRRILEKGIMVHCEIKMKPALNPHHKSQKILWAQNHMSYRPKRKSVIFGDEKKWNLGGQMTGHRTGITCTRNLGVFLVADKVVSR